jgi:hypothetical protein
MNTRQSCMTFPAISSAISSVTVGTGITRPTIHAGEINICSHCSNEPKHEPFKKRPKVVQDIGSGTETSSSHLDLSIPTFITKTVTTVEVQLLHQGMGA